MRKLRNFFLIFSLIFILFPLNAETKEFKVETSRGVQTVQIPDGFTAEEAFLEMAVLYLEERFDHETLIQAVEGYDELLNSYILDNIELNNALLEYKRKSQAIINLYENTAYKKRVISPIFGIQTNLNLEVIFDVGIELFEIFQLNAVYKYPDNFGLRVGFKL